MSAAMKEQLDQCNDNQQVEKVLEKADEMPEEKASSPMKEEALQVEKALEKADEMLEEKTSSPVKEEEELEKAEEALEAKIPAVIEDQVDQCKDNLEVEKVLEEDDEMLEEKASSPTRKEVLENATEALEARMPGFVEEHVDQCKDSPQVQMAPEKVEMLGEEASSPSKDEVVDNVTAALEAKTQADDEEPVFCAWTHRRCRRCSRKPTMRLRRRRCIL
eukprot:TRINITY_DN2246_c0_g1_i3.p1 TRINITY_DN2246_c0_g1~~TRINITY_DN2246_c0_g1_i3.p1  ORF type:complete len:219 (-),score=98.28 TRINITY_DN2246_c0_g1_i3:342-998(-)